jgi:hypothetical protein
MYRTNDPPPDHATRRAPVPWPVIALALGGAGALLVAGGVVVGAFVVSRRSTEKATIAPTSTTHSTSPEVAESSAAPPPEALPEDAPPDESIVLAGTPASSLRARPPWGAREHLTVHAKKTSQYAPQASSPLELFLGASPLAGELERAVVICRFQSFNKHDTFAGDDLHARLTLGSATPEVANDGPEDGNLAFVSAPLVRLKKSDRVAFQVFDRDVFGLTPLTTSSLTFTGGPLTAMDSGAAVECRALTGDALGRAVATKATAASGTLVELEKARLDGRKPTWGYPREALARAEKEIADVAALAGWDDPRARERVARHDSRAASLQAERESVFDELHAHASGALRAGTFEITVDGSSCGTGCVNLSVKNTGASATRFGTYPMSLYFATRAAGPSFAHIRGRQEPIAPGAVVSVPVTTIGALPAGPALLGACSGGTCGVVRVQ